MNYCYWIKKWKNIMKWDGPELEVSALTQRIQDLAGLWNSPVPIVIPHHWECFTKIGYHGKEPDPKKTERKMAKQFFQDKEWILSNKSSIYPLINEVPLVLKSNDDVNADMLAISNFEDKKQIYVIEFKDYGHGHPWAALVQNTLQVKIFNHHKAHFSSLLCQAKLSRKLSQNDQDILVSGIVAAPDDFFTHPGKNENSYKYAKIAISELELPIAMEKFTLTGTNCRPMKKRRF